EQQHGEGQAQDASGGFRCHRQRRTQSCRRDEASAPPRGCPPCGKPHRARRTDRVECPAMRSPPLLPLVFAFAAAAAVGALPPVPEPAENPTTEEKRVLGKILFWDEQLATDDSVACGTCHRPGSGGADPRVGFYPGTDK